MKIRFAVLTLCMTILLAGAPLTAEEPASQTDTVPAVGAADTQAEGANAETMPCAAGAKCCGSAACAQAKERAKEGKAAMADCPCKRNRAKPQHGG
jgi:hypothetical protein